MTQYKTSQTNIYQNINQLPISNNYQNILPPSNNSDNNSDNNQVLLTVIYDLYNKMSELIKAMTLVNEIKHNQLKQFMKQNVQQLKTEIKKDNIQLKDKVKILSDNVVDLTKTIDYRQNYAQTIVEQFISLKSQMQQNIQDSIKLNNEILKESINNNQNKIKHILNELDKLRQKSIADIQIQIQLQQQGQKIQVLKQKINKMNENNKLNKQQQVKELQCIKKLISDNHHKIISQIKQIKQKNIHNYHQQPTVEQIQTKLLTLQTNNRLQFKQTQQSQIKNINKYTDSNINNTIPQSPQQQQQQFYQPQTTNYTQPIDQLVNIQQSQQIQEKQNQIQTEQILSKYRQQSKYSNPMKQKQDGKDDLISTQTSINSTINLSKKQTQQQRKNQQYNYNKNQINIKQNNKPIKLQQSELAYSKLKQKYQHSQHISSYKIFMKLICSNDKKSLIHQLKEIQRQKNQIKIKKQLKYISTNQKQ